jgi:hypothetical protein
VPRLTSSLAFGGRRGRRYEAIAERLSLVDARIAANRRRLVVARYDLAVAHRTLAERVVAMYKEPYI